MIHIASCLSTTDNRNFLPDCNDARSTGRQDAGIEAICMFRLKHFREADMIKSRCHPAALIDKQSSRYPWRCAMLETTSNCGMAPIPYTVALEKIRSLAAGAALVRAGL
jgi:hypothetical protein